MATKETYMSPELRVLTVWFDSGFCNSIDKEDSMNGGPEDVGYDNWLDGFA